MKRRSQGGEEEVPGEVAAAEQEVERVKGKITKK